MKAKDFLKQYQELQKSIKYLKKEIERAELCADTIRSTSDNDGLPHGSNIGHPTEEKAIRIVDARLELKNRLSVMELKRAEIALVLSMLPNNERVALHSHYVDGYKWTYIADHIMYMSTRQVNEYHRRGLLAVQSWLDSNTSD